MSPTDALVDLARRAHPGLGAAEPDFRRVVAELLDEGAAAGEIMAADLYLARACALALPEAVRRFEADHIARVPEWLARLERSPQVVDEVRQRVRARVLVGEPGAAPRIAGYRGRGPLGAWVRVVTVREHARAHRPDGELPDASLDELAGSGELSPELTLLRARYLPLLREAFAAALAALAPRERTLLRMCYVDDLSLAQIGTVIGLDKSNVSRRLASVRADVLARTIEHVRARLGGTSADDVESLLGLVRSSLDLSLSGLL